MKTLNNAYGNADLQVIRLWIRVCAVAIGKTTPPPPRKAGTDPVHEAKFVEDCDSILSEWCRAISGAAELSTSAPNMDWVQDVFESAMYVWAAAEMVRCAFSTFMLEDAIGFSCLLA